MNLVTGFTDFAKKQKDDYLKQLESIKQKQTAQKAIAETVVPVVRAGQKIADVAKKTDQLPSGVKVTEKKSLWDTPIEEVQNKGGIIGTGAKVIGEVSKTIKSGPVGKFVADWGSQIASQAEKTSESVATSINMMAKHNLVSPISHPFGAGMNSPYEEKIRQSLLKTSEKIMEKSSEKQKELEDSVFYKEGLITPAAVSNVVNSVVLSAGLAVLSGGSTLLGAGAISATEALPKYNERLKSGSETKALLTTLGEAGWLTITEKAGLDFMFGNMGKKLVANRVMNFLGRGFIGGTGESLQENIQQIGQNFIEKTFYKGYKSVDKDAPLYQQAKQAFGELTEGWLETTLLTFPTGFIPGGIGGDVQLQFSRSQKASINSTISDIQKKTGATKEQATQFLDSLIKTAQETKNDTEKALTGVKNTTRGALPADYGLGEVYNKLSTEEKAGLEKLKELGVADEKIMEVAQKVATPIKNQLKSAEISKRGVYEQIAEKGVPGQQEFLETRLSEEMDKEMSNETPNPSLLEKIGNALKTLKSQRGAFNIFGKDIGENRGGLANDPRFAFDEVVPEYGAVAARKQIADLKIEGLPDDAVTSERHVSQINRDKISRNLGYQSYNDYLAQGAPSGFAGEGKQAKKLGQTEGKGGRVSERIAKRMEAMEQDRIKRQAYGTEAIRNVREDVARNAPFMTNEQRGTYEVIKGAQDSIKGKIYRNLSDMFKNTKGAVRADFGLGDIYEGGKKLVRGLSKNVETNIVERKLSEGFGDLPQYESVNMSDQAKMANELVKKDPKLAKEIAMGKKLPSGDLLPESVFVAVEENAIKDKDIDTIRELAQKSKLATQATEMGQRIRALGERNQFSPIEAIKEVKKARMENEQKRGKKVEVEKKKIKQDIQKEIRKSAPKIETWASFIDSIVC